MAALTVPDWTTAEFFQSCLQAQETQSIIVTNHTIKPLDLPDGTNYGSKIFRAQVDFTKGDKKYSISLIIKGPLTKEELLTDDAYEKERKFYDFINKTYQYCQHELVPKHYISPINSCVVLEDVSVSGYLMADRKKFLDLKHCELALKAKAKLHALSLAVYRDNPEIMEPLAKKFLKNNKIHKSLVEGSLRCMIAYLEDKPNCEEYLDVVKEASTNDNMEKMYQEVEESSSNKPLKVLIQCDPWIANMMFRYDSLGNVDSVKLLDFQALAFASPLKEIVTFMSLCPNLEVRKTKTNYLYDLYINAFNENLAELGCPERLNFEEAKSEINSMSPLMLFITCSSIPTLLSEEAADVSEYISGTIMNGPIREKAIFKLYQHKAFPEYLDVIANEGVFNYVKEKMKLMKQQ